MSSLALSPFPLLSNNGFMMTSLSLALLKNGVYYSVIKRTEVDVSLGSIPLSQVLEESDNSLFLSLK